MFIVTGGAGFIGSVIVDELNRVYPDIPVVVSDYMEQNNKWQNLNARVLRYLLNPAELGFYLDAHADDISAVIHMGAISSTGETDVEKLAEENIRTSLDLCHWCARHNVPFIYASSAATYGAGEYGFTDNDNLHALMQLRPLNAYGFSKSLVDKAITAEPNKPRQTVGLKFFNVYGPNEYHKGGMCSVVYHAFKQISETGRVSLFKSHHTNYADGEQMRDFVYVKDVARAVVWFLQNPQHSGIFNMGTGVAHSFNDLVHATFKAMGKPAQIDYVPTPEHLRKHYQYYTQANMEKFRAVAPTFQFSTLGDGVADYVQNYLMKDNPYL